VKKGKKNRPDEINQFPGISSGLWVALISDASARYGWSLYSVVLVIAVRSCWSYGSGDTWSSRSPNAPWPFQKASGRKIGRRHLST